MLVKKILWRNPFVNLQGFALGMYGVLMLDFYYK